MSGKAILWAPPLVYGMHLVQKQFIRLKYCIRSDPLNSHIWIHSDPFFSYLDPFRPLSFIIGSIQTLFLFLSYLDPFRTFLLFLSCGSIQTPFSISIIFGSIQNLFAISNMWIHSDTFLSYLDPLRPFLYHIWIYSAVFDPFWSIFVTFDPTRYLKNW